MWGNTDYMLVFPTRLSRSRSTLRSRFIGLWLCFLVLVGCSSQQPTRPLSPGIGLPRNTPAPQQLDQIPYSTKRAPLKLGVIMKGEMGAAKGMRTQNVVLEAGPTAMLPAKRGETFTITASVEPLLGKGAQLVVYPIWVKGWSFRFTAPADGYYYLAITEPDDIGLNYNISKYRWLIERGSGDPVLQAQVAIRKDEALTAEGLEQRRKFADSLSKRTPQPTPSRPSTPSGSTSSDPVVERAKRMASEDTPGHDKFSRLGEVRYYKPLRVELDRRGNEVRIAVVAPSVLGDLEIKLGTGPCPMENRQTSFKRLEEADGVAVWGASERVDDPSVDKKLCVTVSRDKAPQGSDPAMTVGVIVWQQ